MKINEEKLASVAEKLDVNASVIRKAKRLKIIKISIYSFSQMCVNAISYALIFPLYYLFSSESWSRPTYPVTFFTDLGVLLQNYYLWMLHLGNFAGSFVMRKKAGIKTWIVGLVSFFNFIVVILVYFIVHKAQAFSVAESLVGTGYSIDYGVYSKKELNSI